MKKKFSFFTGALSKRFGMQKYLEKLSFMGLVKIKKQKVSKGFGMVRYYYFWDLTAKGKKLISKNKALSTLWKNKQYKTLFKIIKKEKINKVSSKLSGS